MCLRMAYARALTNWTLATKLSPQSARFDQNTMQLGIEPIFHRS